MKSLSGLAKTYFVVGVVVCLWFIIASANGWKAPNLGIAAAMKSSGGRSSGGYWGGGK